MRILLPTDYSDHAYHAAQYAAGLMGVEHVSYVLVHTYMDADPSVTSWGSMAEELYRAANEGMVHWLERIRGSEAFRGAKVGKDVVFGPLTGVLNEMAREKSADLVVMGTQGRSGGGLLGSNAASVVKQCHVPVLVVPSKAGLNGVHRILFADDQRRVKPHDLKMLLHIALRTRAEVVLAHVLRNAEELPRTALVALFDELLQAVPHRYVSEEGKDVAGTIDMLAEREGAAMIAVLHRHAGFLEDLFRISTAKRLALHTNLPLLVMQHEGNGDDDLP